jgi:hypothetical protein
MVTYSFCSDVIKELVQFIRESQPAFVTVEDTCSTVSNGASLRQPSMVSCYNWL